MFLPLHGNRLLMTVYSHEVYKKAAERVSRLQVFKNQVYFAPRREPVVVGSDVCEQQFDRSSLKARTLELVTEDVELDNSRMIWEIALVELDHDVCIVAFVFAWKVFVVEPVHEEAKRPRFNLF